LLAEVVLFAGAAASCAAALRNARLRWLRWSL
jgi:hypothetical protein